MLVPVLVALLALALAALLVARATLVVLDRLGLQLMPTLLWLGLAEWPLEPRKHRRRLSEIVAEAA